MNSSMRIFIFSVIILKANGNDISTHEPTLRQLDCDFNAANAELVCDCRNKNKPFTLQTITGNVKGVTVQNCKRLLVRTGTFNEVSYINTLLFQNIGDLILDRGSLEFRKHYPTLKVNLTFYNVNFYEIVSHSMGGYIENIAFKYCGIGKLNAYSIDSAHQIVHSILFENTVIDSIESETLKRLHIDDLIMQNTAVLSHLPSRTFSALTILNQFSISNCSFATISPQAFDLEDVKDFIFNENSVDQLEGNAFRINVNGRISIERNNFSQISYQALSGIDVGQGVKQRHEDIKFISNTINSTKSPIRFEVNPEFYLQISDLKFDKVISCEDGEKLRNNVFLQPYANTVSFRMAHSPDKYTSLTNVLLNECNNTSYVMIAIVSGVIILVLILVIIVVAFFYRYWSKNKPERPLNMVIPDGKTYRETQIVFQVENAGLLKTNL